MVARPQLTITRGDTQSPLMLQKMPPTFRAFNEHRTTKLTLEEVATDLFYWKASTYLLILNHYSRYIEISKLKGQSEIISHKINLCLAWVLQEVVSDNRPQYSSHECKQFAAKYGFTHTTSSPCYLRSNREVERTVKTIKSLLKKNDDRYIVLMIYHSTPLHNGFSSLELLMNQRLCTTLPILESQLQPFISQYSVVCEKETMRKANTKKIFDIRHRANSYSKSIASRTISVDIGEER